MDYATHPVFQESARLTRCGILGSTALCSVKAESWETVILNP